MATLKVRNVSRSCDVSVQFVSLDKHSPLDVMKIIVERDASQKPPKGTIWLMRPFGWQSGEPELDQFETFKSNQVDDTIKYELVQVR